MNKNSEKKAWQVLLIAKKTLESWCEMSNVALHRIEFVYAEIGDTALQVYVFYKADEDLKLYQQNGMTTQVEETFRESLAAQDYLNYFSNIRFEHDSHENVEENYQGSYFFRLR